MTDLAAWLLQRIAEDEDAAQALLIETGLSGTSHIRAPLWEASLPRQPESVVRFMARWDPARVAAECQAKRRVVEQCRRVIADDEGRGYYSDGWDGLSVAKATLHLLAKSYAEHPDFREEWRR